MDPLVERTRKHGLREGGRDGGGDVVPVDEKRHSRKQGSDEVEDEVTPCTESSDSRKHDRDGTTSDFRQQTSGGFLALRTYRLQLVAGGS